MIYQDTVKCKLIHSLEDSTDECLSCDNSPKCSKYSQNIRILYMKNKEFTKTLYTVTTFNDLQNIIKKLKEFEMEEFNKWQLILHTITRLLYEKELGL